MKKYTDVSVTLYVEGYDLSEMTHIHITFRSGDTLIDVTDVTVVGEHELVAVLTQEQTGSFQAGQGADVQLNFFDNSGFRRASNIAHLSVESNLLRRILHE